MPKHNLRHTKRVAENVTFACELRGRGTRSAIALHLGVTNSYMTQMLQGLRKIPLDHACEMAELLHFSLDELLLYPPDFRKLCKVRYSDLLPVR